MTGFGFGGLGVFPPPTAPTPLGWQPLPIEPVFVEGQDWIVTLVPSTDTDDPIWPDGTTITANVYAANTPFWQPSSSWTPLFTWDATITGNTVTIKGPYADTDTVTDGAVMRITVVIPNGDSANTYVWCEGPVRRDDPLRERAV